MRKIQIKKTKRAENISIIAKTRIQIKKTRVQSRQNKNIENINSTINKTHIDVVVSIKEKNKEEKYSQILDN